MPAPVVQDRDGGGTTTSVGSAARRCGERRAIATGGSRRRRWAAEHITERVPPKKRAPPPILRPGLDHVAALAEGREAGVGVVRGVVIAVCDGQTVRVQRSRMSASAATRKRRPRPSRHRPASASHQRPSSDHRRGGRPSPPVWPPPALTAVFRPPQPAHVRELGPADGVEKAMLRPDRHSGAENPVRGPSCGEPAHPSCSHLATAARQRAGGMQPKRQRDVVAPG